jgi:RNA polymerase sigma-70 factor (ECF subfamily)
MEYTIDQSTSATLLVRIKEYQDEAAWKEFYRRYVPLIHAWSRRRGLSDDDVEDVTEAVLISLARSMKTFAYDPDKGFRKWLKTVVGHEIMNLWRGRGRRPGDRGTGDSKVHDLLSEQPESVDELLEEVNGVLEQRRQWLQQALTKVQGKYQGSRSWDAFRLTFLENVPVAEAAKKLGMTYGAVTQAKYRIKTDVQEEATRLESAAV